VSKKSKGYLLVYLISSFDALMSKELITYRHQQFVNWKYCFIAACYLVCE